MTAAPPIHQVAYELRVGDAREVLSTLPDGVFQCAITSPPYFGLRDYGVDGQIGLEADVSSYIGALVAVFAQVWRVLRADGVLWVNIGDSYARAQTTNVPQTKNVPVDYPVMPSDVSGRNFEGAKPKDLLGVPWRLAFALRDAGWYLRQDVIWHKPNGMPESVTDRCTKAHEYVFMLTKDERYFFDVLAIREPAVGGPAGNKKRKMRPGHETLGAALGSQAGGIPWSGGELRQRRSVWSINTKPYAEAHFATFPEALVEPMIAATSTVGSAVLDPFCGSGTVGAVALPRGRHFFGCDLNSKYIELARERILKATTL